MSYQTDFLLENKIMGEVELRVGANKPGSVFSSSTY